jgi:transcriptional regulator with XRE-family HTH domain
MTETEIRKILGENIKNRRLELRLSQEQLAERVDMSANFLSSIEIGKKWVSPLTLAKLSDALRTETWTLFKPAGAVSDESAHLTEHIFSAIIENIESLRTVYRTPRNRA